MVTGMGASVAIYLKSGESLGLTTALSSTCVDITRPWNVWSADMILFEQIPTEESADRNFHLWREGFFLRLYYA